jgi:bifunctional DNase/RNase
LNRGTISEFVRVNVAEVGFTDESGAEGLVWLRSEEGRAFAMRSFSGESAIHMERFARGDRSSIPSVFNMVEELADKEGLHLRGVEVYPVGEVLRADMQFLGRGKDITLGGYRVSDAIALSLLYDAPIMLHRSLLESEQEEDPRK